MLNKEELAAFLALLLAFADTNRLSGTQMAKLFGVSHASTIRWLTLARTTDPKTTVYNWTAAPIIEKINKLNRIDAERGMYEAISTQKPAERAELLQRVLEDKLVW